MSRNNLGTVATLSTHLHHHGPGRVWLVQRSTWRDSKLWHLWIQISERKKKKEELNNCWVHSTRQKLFTTVYGYYRQLGYNQGIYQNCNSRLPQPLRNWWTCLAVVGLSALTQFPGLLVLSMSPLYFTSSHALWEYQNLSFHIRAIIQLSAPGAGWCVSFYYYYQIIRWGCVLSSALRRKVTAQACHHTLTTPTFQEAEARELLQVEG